MRKVRQAKIKLMYIVYSLDTGGLEKLVLEMVKRVNKDIFAPSVCCLTCEGTLSQQFRKAGISVFYMQKGGGVRYLLPFRIAILLKREKIDIVHTHDSSANLYGSLAAKIAGVKAIINTEHGGIYFETNRKRWFNKLLCLLNNKEVCVSDNVKNDLQDMGLSNKRLTVIHNGIDFDKFNIDIDMARKRREVGFEDSDFVITTIGRLSWEKNQKLFLESAKIIASLIPEAKFLIVGNGLLRKDLENYARELGIAQKTKFLGDRNDIPGLLKISNCFILSSSFESFGLTLLEAMAAKVPVISTDVGGIGEIVKDGKAGILVAKEDAKALAAAVMRLKNDRAFAEKLVTHSLDIVKENYSIERMIKQHEDLYLRSYRGNFVTQKGGLPLRVLTFGLDDRALLEVDGHSKRWNSRMGSYVDRLDVIVEMREKGNYADKYIADNVRIIPIYVPHPALYSFIAYKRALKEHEKYSYDLVTTEEPFRTGYAGWLFKKKTGVALSVEYHNDTFYNNSWVNERPVSHRIYMMAGSRILRDAYSVRCVNKKNYFEILKICGNDSGKMIEIMPVPTALYDSDKHGIRAKEIRKEIVKNDNDVIILFVGRLAAVKKVDELIRVYAEIRKTHKNTHLVIVGDGHERERLHRLAKKVGSEGIVFKGYIPEEDVLAYFGASDIFVNPAHVETYGKVFIEAMSAGKPVVLTSGAGAVGDKLCVNNINALVTKPGNLDELKNALVSLIEDESLRSKLGENAPKEVMSKFNYENSLKAMSDFYERSVNKRMEKIKV